jgi:hypothetical protein
MTRAERAVVAVALREDGYTAREIAEELGISRSYASSLYSDPTGEGERARKDRYRGTCEECGAATDGSNGPGSASHLCSRCAPARHAEEQRMSRDEVVALLRAGNEACRAALGRDLRTTDWYVSVGYDSLARHYSEARMDEGDRLRAALERAGVRLPHLGIVRREVGGIAAVADLLGWERAPIGGPSHRRAA